MRISDFTKYFSNYIWPTMASIRHERTLISAIPKDVAEVMDELDIDKTWDYLEKTFRLNKTRWKKDFEDAYVKSTRAYSKLELFIRYGHQNIQPGLNIILFRKDNYPTWINMIRYIVADKIQKAEEERGRIAQEYGRNSGYKIHNRKY